MEQNQMQDKNSRNEKVAIVTGASRGIGNGIARALASEGIAVVCADRHSDRDASYMEEMKALCPACMHVQTDIESRESREHLVKTAFDAFGHVDFLINNAGVAPLQRNDILEMTEESMDRLLSVNLKGTFFLTQACANAMMAHSCGEAIVNITSMSAYTSSTNRGEYCISKAGLSMVTTLFADRLASSGIRVYEIRPGIIRTDMTEKVTEKYDRLIAGGLLPIARWGEPDDIGRTVLAIVKGYLPYSTGEVINVDGGFHIQRL